MLRDKLAWIVLAVSIGMVSAGCGSVEDLTGGGDDDSSSKNEEATPVELTTTSGKTVALSGEWARGCTGGTSTSSDDTYTIDGENVTVNHLEWRSAAACAGDHDFTSVIGFTAKKDKTVTGISWVDGTGVAGAAPAGLEAVTDANGLTTVLKSATLTPNTQAGADDLTTDMDCGFTDWAVGVTKDILECFIGGGSGEAKESWLLDDTTSTTAMLLYASADEPVLFDADGYPTEIYNVDPLMQ